MTSKTQIFVNLPVKDLKKSMAFFTQLGFEFDPRFTDEKAACMLIGEGSYVMLLTEPFFKTFTKKDVAQAAGVTEVILAISAESKAAVDEMVRLALAAGGSVSNDKMEDGFMYSWSFQDVDHHLWEVMYMDENAFSAEGTTG